jgi:SAM-dependent methyltransferase
LKIKDLTLRFRDKKWFDRSGSVAKRINNKIVEEEFSRNPYIEINFNRLFEGINVRGKSILIIGVNRGYEAELFLKLGAKAVTGIDVFLPKEIYKNRKFQFVLSAAEKLPFDDFSFDIVYSQAVLEHVADLEKTFFEAVRVLQSGGLSLHIASPLWYSRDGHHLPHLLGRWPWCHVGRDAEELIEWVENQGLSGQMDKDWQAAVREAMDKKSINQSPSTEYLNAINSLMGVDIVENSFDLDPSAKENVTSDILDRLPPNLQSIELERFSFISVIKKF